MKVVRYVGKGRGLGPEYKSAIANGSRAAVVSSLRDGGNVTLRFKLDSKGVGFENEPLTRDFLDLATAIYIADEIEPRKRSRDHWSRRFDIVAPVHRPKLWAKHEPLLRRMLHTLSGDDFQFTWVKRPELDTLSRHRLRLPDGFDAVCLFSGGMDSFLGAFQLLQSGRRLLLVGHQADGTAASAQTALARWLQHRFPGACRLVQCRVARSMARSSEFKLPAKREDTHRVRSLLFIALAVAIANATGIEEIYLPENGLIALNAPLQKSRLGTLSTRTAHPKYLSELGDFLQAGSVFRGSIKNPFIYLSKTDMTKGQSGLAEPLLRSVSCARPSRYKDRGVRHCGYCVPCIYRRIAMLEAGLDRPSEYAYSVFDQLLTLDTAKQLDFRALVQWSERIGNASPLERELAVLSHGTFPLSAGERFGTCPAATYSAWGDMLARWSENFLAGVDHNTSSEVRRSLGRTQKLEQVSS